VEGPAVFAHGQQPNREIKTDAASARMFLKKDRPRLALNLKGTGFRSCEPPECPREILKTGFVWKSSHLICELLLSLGHVVVRISMEYAAAEASCLRREGLYEKFPLLTTKVPEQISGESTIAKS
jgi:hypothetical protein